jgi:hypothetical protein
MIRNLMLATALITFTAGSALASTRPRAARTQADRTLEMPVGETTKESKKVKKPRKAKKAKASEGTVLAPAK